MGGNKNDETCSMDSCPSSAVTSWAHENFCVNHFVSRCYEYLDRFDSTGRSWVANHTQTEDLGSLIEECSRKTLELSLGCKHLDNLQRGRLLDILLWAEELKARGCTTRSVHSFAEGTTHFQPAAARFDGT